VEGTHPITEHPRPRRVVGRMAVGGAMAAGYVTKSSGEGQFIFAAKSGRMVGASQIVCGQRQRTTQFPTEKDLKVYIKKWIAYGATYKGGWKFLPEHFIATTAARRSFRRDVRLDTGCFNRLTFDSYLYKRVGDDGNPGQRRSS